MSEKKKRSRLGTMWDVVVDAVHEPILKHKDKVNAKAVGEIVGKGCFHAAKPFVSMYDGFRKGFNGKEPQKEEVVSK